MVATKLPRNDSDWGANQRTFRRNESTKTDSGVDTSACMCDDVSPLQDQREEGISKNPT